MFRDETLKNKGSIYIGKQQQQPEHQQKYGETTLTRKFQESCLFIKKVDIFKILISDRILKLVLIREATKKVLFLWQCH